MTSIAQTYIEEVRRQFDETQVPVFAPDTEVSVGTIGSFEDGQFIPRGHLSDRGATVTVRSGPPTPIWTFRSSSDVTLSPTAKILLPDGTPAFSATLSLGSKRGVAAAFRDVVESVAVDEDEFDRVMWELYLAGHLRADRLVAWSVRRASLGTVVVSAEKGAHLELTAPALETLTFEGLAARVTFGQSSGIGYSVSNAPLTAVVRLKRITPDRASPVMDVHRYDTDSVDTGGPPQISSVRVDDVLSGAG